MEIFLCYPRVIRVGISLPVHEVLHLTSSPLTSGIQNRLDFVLFFTIDDWRRSCEGRAICLRLLIWKEEVCVEDVVYLH